MNSILTANLGSDRLIGEYIIFGPEGAVFKAGYTDSFQLFRVAAHSSRISASQLGSRFLIKPQILGCTCSLYLYQNGSNDIFNSNAQSFILLLSSQFGLFRGRHIHAQQ